MSRPVPPDQARKIRGIWYVILAAAALAVVLNVANAYGDAGEGRPFRFGGWSPLGLMALAGFNLAPPERKGLRWALLGVGMVLVVVGLVEAIRA